MRTGDWIVTFSGRKFFVTDPHVDDICIEDIAHALSLVCRYGGHCRAFYSVAQHSCIVADLIAQEHPRDFELQMRALLHDATEAYIGDVVRPLKYAMPNYLEFEANLDAIVSDAFGLGPLHRNGDPDDTFVKNGDEPRIKAADNAALMAERRDIVNHNDIAWSISEEPCATQIRPVACDLAERMFLARFAHLSDKLSALAVA